MERRNVVLGGVAAGASIVTGLTLTSLLNNEPNDGASQKLLKLSDIVVVNDHDQPHEVTIEARYNGEEIVNENHRLGISRDEQSVAIRDLPSERGTYELAVSLANGQESLLTPEYYPDYECVGSALVIIESSGTLSPFYVEPCQEETTDA